jgi:hypothetical protein
VKSSSELIGLTYRYVNFSIKIFRSVANQLFVELYELRTSIVE